MQIPEGMDPEMEELLVECCVSTKLFCQTFMPHTFNRPFSKDHDIIFDILDNPNNRKVAFAMPRGWGKTSIFNKAYPAKRIVYQDVHYVVPISATGPSAREFSENLKSELLTNEELIGVFGSIKSKAISDSDGPFSSLEWVTSTGIKVMPRGAGQQLRGRIFRDHRPDLFISDDLEDDEGVESDERREKLRRWFLSAVQNSVYFCDPTWRIVVVGTILHEDSLLANLLDKERHPDWVTHKCELCDDDLKSNWKSYMSDREVIKLYDSYKAAEALDVFAREFQNRPFSKEDQGIKESYFKPYTRTEKDLNHDPAVETIILCDPARTMKTGSARTAIVGVSVNTRDNWWYVRDVIFEKLFPDELYEAMFEMAQRLNALVLAPEVTGLEEYILQPLRNEMSKRGVFYPIVAVKPRQGKTGPKRSGGLVPLYRQGHIWHNESACRVLESHLVEWPKPTKWDLIDALAGTIYVLDEGERYFSCSAAQTPEEIEAEYDAIDNPPAIKQHVIV